MISCENLQNINYKTVIYNDKNFKFLITLFRKNRDHAYTENIKLYSKNEKHYNFHKIQLY